MKEYKVCPICKKKNPPNLYECPICKGDLWNVDPTNDESENINNDTEICDEIVSATVKVCDVCGTRNDPNIRKCVKCKSDISDIIPSDENTVSEKSKQQIILNSIDGKCSFEMNEETIIVGKDHTMGEYLSTKGYVSHVHAVITLEDDGLYIKNLSRTNSTYVNNVKTQGKTKLNDGDEIGLGGGIIDGKHQEKAAFLIVRIS